MASKEISYRVFKGVISNEFLLWGQHEVKQIGANLTAIFIFKACLVSWNPVGGFTFIDKTC